MASSESLFRRVVVCAFVVVAVFVAWVGLNIGGSGVEHGFDDAMTAAAAVAAAVCCFWAGSRHRAELRRFWVLLGCAMAAWSVGEIVWGFYEVVLGRMVPAVSLADVGYLGAVPLAAAAVLLYPSEAVGGVPRVRGLLDGLIVAGSVLSVSWVLVLASVVRANGESPFGTSVQLAYPLGDAVILSLVVVALARTPIGARQSLGWVLGGLAAMALADSGFVYLTAVGGYATGDLIDTGWLVAYLAIGLGALYAIVNRPGTVAAPVESVGSLRRSMLIYVPTVAASALAGVKIVEGGVIDRVLWLTLLGTVVLVIARQVLAVAENATLTASVEAKVIARTDELRHQALHDALTGLPNRSLIMDRIEQLLAHGRRTKTSGAALYLDLDGFKTVNDSLGHAHGDQLLQAVARRLTTALRDTDSLGRMGGDEFVILVDGGALEDSPELVAHRLLDVLHQPFEIDGVPLAITASIGIAIGDRTSAGDLLRDADVALYEAKASGKNRYACYQPEMQDAIHDRLELELDLRFAVERNEFRLVYQPIYNLDTMDLLGVEALIRWHHPTRGVIAPNDFIPLLEDSGGIIDVGRWVLNEACRQTQIWHHQGNTLSVAVNVSGRQLDNDSIVDDVRHALNTSGLQPKSLTIEVTETSLIRDTDATARRLQSLKSLGVRIAIDDFGTGYSSLAYLQKFPVDCLKIDRAFTAAIDRSSESRALFHTLVQVGKALGLTTLAEGVETPDQADCLHQEDCDLVQGFHFARPLDARTLETTLLHQPLRKPIDTIH